MPLHCYTTLRRAMFHRDLFALPSALLQATSYKDNAVAAPKTSNVARKVFLIAARDIPTILEPYAQSAPHTFLGKVVRGLLAAYPSNNETLPVPHPLSPAKIR